MSAPREDAASPAPTLEQTFRTERRRMLGYFAWRVGRDDAPDFLQEVFMRAAGSPNAAHIENPTHYVWKVARNLLTDRARRNRRHQSIFVPFDEHRDPPAAPEQTLQIEADDLLRLYEEAVDRLSPKTRRVYLMQRVDELSYREIHERLGISIATVKYHMMKALAHIERVVDAHQ